MHAVQRRSRRRIDQAAKPGDLAVAVECRGLPCRWSAATIGFDQQVLGREWPDDERALTGGIQRCRRRCLGPAGLMEGRGRLPEARRHHGSALGTARGPADPPPRARQAGFGLRIPIRARCVAANPHTAGAGRGATDRSAAVSLSHSTRTPTTPACRRFRRLNDQRSSRVYGPVGSQPVVGLIVFVVAAIAFGVARGRVTPSPPPAMLVSPSARVVRSIQLTFSGVAAAPGFETDHFPAIASDGARVYFNERTEQRDPPHTRTGLGGRRASCHHPDAVPFRSPPARLARRIARPLVREFDHAQVEGPLWVIPTVGEAPRLQRRHRCSRRRLSPDGKRVVFACREGLYVAASDGSDARQLATIPGRAFWVRWSPDGARLRFTLFYPQNSTRSIWKSRPRVMGCSRCLWGAANTTSTAAANGARTGGISSSAGSVRTGQTSG